MTRDVVMAGLRPGHPRLAYEKKIVDARDKRGHDVWQIQRHSRGFRSHHRAMVIEHRATFLEAWHAHFGR
jgi:hypothetical protein